MIEKVSLWHVTPVHIGTGFFDATTSVLEANEELYSIVNDPYSRLPKGRFSKNDIASIRQMRKFLKRLKTGTKDLETGGISFCPEFPGITGCIAKFMLTLNMYCYIMYNGTAVFLEYGQSIPFSEERYFSIPVFLERQKYEDDYCVNQKTSVRKKPLYDFLSLMWKTMGRLCRHYSSSIDFRNNGVSYTLCMTMIDVPDFESNKLDNNFLKNINALLDTSPFSNIYDESQWGLIKSRLDEYHTENPQIKELSENLVFADSWSGVVVAGDLKKNKTCLTWLMEFEIILQSMWLLFDAYCENVLRQDLSVIELQSILNKVEVMKINLDNDISSNMEQSRHIMRNSLIESSDINVIYTKMFGILKNKLKMKMMRDDKTKSRYSLLSDIALLSLAIVEIYGVVVELIKGESFGSAERLAMGIMGAVALICIWVMVKGKQ